MKNIFKNKLIDLDDVIHKRVVLLMAVITAFAFIIRLFAFLSIKESLYYDYMLFDERIYHKWAMELLNGTWKSKEVYEFAPAPAYFMAFLYKMIAPDINLFRAVNLLFGTFTCLVTGFIGLELKGKRTAVFACLVSSLYAPLIFYSVVPLKTSMSIFLFSLFIWFFFRIMNHRNGLWQYAFLGIVAGVMINVRPNFLVAIPVAYCFIVSTGWIFNASFKKLSINTLLLASGLILAASPFILRNYIVAGKVALTASQSGFNLYIGNNPDNKIPYYRPVTFASSSPFQQGIQFNIEASKRAGKILSAQEASSFWTKEVIKNAMDKPSGLFYKLLQKTLIYFNSFEPGDHYHIGFMSDFVPFFKIPMFSFWFIMPFGMTGLLIGFFGNGRAAAGALVFSIYGLTLIAFFCNTRYRLPMMVILIPAGIYCIEKMVTVMKNKQYKTGIFSGIVIFSFFVMAFLPVTGTDDMTAYYNTHALVLNAAGKTKDAVRYWDMSSNMKKPYSAFANLSLAGFYVNAGKAERAEHFLSMIPQNSFAAPTGYSMLGDIALRSGDREKAILYYRKSLQINSGERGVWKKLIIELEKKDKEAAMAEFQKFKVISSFY